VRACNIQVRDHAAPAWGYAPVKVKLAKAASIEAVQA
jgi:hypothetical protein